MCLLLHPLQFEGRYEQLDISNHWLGFQAPLQQTETGPLKSDKVTQLLQPPGRPSDTPPCLGRHLPPAPRQSFPAPSARGSRGRKGQLRAESRRPSRLDPEVFVSLSRLSRPGAGERKEGVQGAECSRTSASLRNLPQHSQPAIQTQSNNREEERPLAVGARQLGSTNTR